jgi:hypothetical protein
MRQIVSDAALLQHVAARTDRDAADGWFANVDCAAKTHPCIKCLRIVEKPDYTSSQGCCLLNRREEIFTDVPLPHASRPLMLVST